MEGLDAISINFSQDQVLLLNLCLAFIMFGVALHLRREDFLTLRKAPRSVLVGLSSQLLLLPILTVLLIWILPVTQSVGMGMLLIACCPGGNISNFASAWSHSNATLSVTLTSVVTVAAAFVTPLSFFFWSMFLPYAIGETSFLEVSLWAMLKVVVLIILIPLILGILFQHTFPRLTLKFKSPINFISLLILFAFIVVALYNNKQYLIGTFMVVSWIVILHNGLGLMGGYFYSRAMGESQYNARAIGLETGVQNAGLGLVLIFNFFPDRGGMMIIAAWWGVWNICSALLLSTFWRFQSRMKKEEVKTVA